MHRPRRSVPLRYHDNAAASSARLFPKKICIRLVPKRIRSREGEQSRHRKTVALRPFQTVRKLCSVSEARLAELFLNKPRGKVAFQKVLSETMRSFTRRVRTSRP